MTVSEKAAYLKGLSEGLVDASSAEGKLWACLTDLLADIAHEIEDLQDTDADYADVLDEVGEELSYLEELTCGLDFDCGSECCPGGSCDGCPNYDECAGAEDESDDDDPDYDGVIYDVTCPSCGEEISFDQDTLNEGFTTCPICGEKLEFSLDDEDEETDS